ncbi:phosphoserine transaminase [Demequina aurantiaca]|uniref:phosphoserine transaminase n=1 Tax=Demequina aurantiaca TaxID=676200 RepID=UPI000784CF49|nr:phosphoserine transaminase [Demequina aurantiaca]
MFEPITIPANLLPTDGRFGSGPSKVRGEQLDALVAAQPLVLGTSHRQAPVKDLVGDVRSMLSTFFNVPDGYEVILGNGGSTMFWDAAAFSLVERKAQHAAFGEFGQKFAKATTAAPHLEASSVRTAEPGTVVLPEAEDGIDTYAWPHNETSTGAMVQVVRPPAIGDALTVVDGTSAAGGLFLEARQADVYYFAPQKSFASDGGIWFALISPAAIERIERIAASGRYIPESLSLATALTNSRVNQTLNTPAVATLVLMRAQLEWMLAGGGMDFVTYRTSQSARSVYEWAESRAWAEAFVTEPSNRSTVVATIGLADKVDSSLLRQHLRANGVVDVDPYRKLGRNQIRIGMYPAVDPEDVSALTRSIDYLVERLLT